MRASFRVETAPLAEADLRAIYESIARNAKGEAAKWLRHALAAIRSLRTLPFRFEVVPECETLGREYRHMIFGNFRIIYRVDGQVVRINRIIRAARQLTPTMLREEQE